jgi:hypothetical protein
VGPVIRSRSATLLSLVAAVAGGLIAWISAFAGLKAWGLVGGVLTSAVLSLVFARRAASRPSMSVMATFAFAFILLTWPILLLVVGYLRYVITGQGLGN